PRPASISTTQPSTEAAGLSVTLQNRRLCSKELEAIMRRLGLSTVWLMALASLGAAQTSPTGPYKVLKTVKVGGDGSFDYVYADVAGRRLYIPRGSAPPHVTVFNLDTLAPAG